MFLWLCMNKTRLRNNRDIRFEMIDASVFIDMVRSHKCLWDNCTEIYRNKEFKERIWTLISEEFGKSVDECKTFWQSLKAKYTRLLKENGPNCGEKWVDFNKLSFLEHVLKPRRTHTNFKRKVIKSSQSKQFDDDDGDANDEESSRNLRSNSNPEVLFALQQIKKSCSLLNIQDEIKIDKLKKLMKLQKLVCLINEVSKLKKIQPLLKQKMKRTVKRRWWVRPTNWYKDSLGIQINLMRKLDPEEFFTFTRMSVATFDELLELIKCRIQKRSLRTPVPPDVRLYITLRHLATGDSYHSLHLLFRVGKSLVRKIILETCDALWEVLYPIVLAEPIQEEWEKISLQFEEKWNLPFCCGALDGKHIREQAPPKSGSKFRNYKNFFSNVLLALCDASYNFVYVDIGAYGSQSDGGILENSTLGEMLQQNELKFPSAKYLPGTETPFSYYVIADTAFPLTHNIITPYVPPRKRRRTVLTWGRTSTRRRTTTRGRIIPIQGRTVSIRCRSGLKRYQIGSNGSRKIRTRTIPHRSEIGLLPNNVLYFNYRLRRGRITIENTFGILASRWRIYHRTIIAAPENVDRLVKATVVLHNFIKSKKGDNIRYCPPGYADSESNGDIISGIWRTETSNEVLCLVNNPMRIEQRNYKAAASNNRDVLLHYIAPPTPSCL